MTQNKMSSRILLVRILLLTYLRFLNSFKIADHYGRMRVLSMHKLSYSNTKYSFPSKDLQKVIASVLSVTLAQFVIVSDSNAVTSVLPIISLEESPKLDTLEETRTPDDVGNIISNYLKLGINGLRSSLEPVFDESITKIGEIVNAEEPIIRQSLEGIGNEISSYEAVAADQLKEGTNGAITQISDSLVTNIKDLSSDISNFYFGITQKLEAEKFTISTQIKQNVENLKTGVSTNLGVIKDAVAVKVQNAGEELNSELSYLEKTVESEIESENKVLEAEYTKDLGKLKAGIDAEYTELSGQTTAIIQEAQKLKISVPSKSPWLSKTTKTERVIPPPPSAAAIDLPAIERDAEKSISVLSVNLELVTSEAPAFFSQIDLSVIRADVQQYAVPLSLALVGVVVFADTLQQNFFMNGLLDEQTKRSAVKGVLPLSLGYAPQQAGNSTSLETLQSESASLALEVQRLINELAEKSTLIEVLKTEIEKSSGLEEQLMFFESELIRIRREFGSDLQALEAERTKVQSLESWQQLITNEIRNMFIARGYMSSAEARSVSLENLELDLERFCQYLDSDIKELNKKIEQLTLQISSLQSEVSQINQETSLPSLLTVEPVGKTVTSELPNLMQTVTVSGNTNANATKRQAEAGDRPSPSVTKAVVGGGSGDNADRSGSSDSAFIPTKATMVSSGYRSPLMSKVRCDIGDGAVLHYDIITHCRLITHNIH